MNKKLLLWFILSLLIITFCSSLTLASFETKPIYPLEGPIIGGEFNYQPDNWSLTTKGAYDFQHSAIYYYCGGNYRFNNKLGLKLNYNYWLNDTLPDYLYQQGVQSTLTYNKNMTQETKFSFFTGQVGKELTAAAKTSYFNLNHKQDLYYDWQNKAQLILDLTSGRVNTTEKIYYSSQVTVPITLNKFKIVPQLGYIKQTDKLAPQYKLNNYVAGYYTNEDNNTTETGNRVAALNLERKFTFLSAVNLPVINLLDVVTFINTGDILNSSELIEDFQLHTSAGVGVSLTIGQAEFKLQKAVTDQRNWETIFSVTANY